MRLGPGPDFAALTISAQENLTSSNNFACRTQLPHAVGAAYAFKMDQKPLCSVTYFGEGATSEVCPTLLLYPTYNLYLLSEL